MKILQFAFSGEGDNVYLPHNYPNNCIAYTGTHDNDTFLGWYSETGSVDESLIAKISWIKQRRDITSGLY